MLVVVLAVAVAVAGDSALPLQPATITRLVAIPSRTPARRAPVQGRVFLVVVNLFIVSTPGGYGRADRVFGNAGASSGRPPFGRVTDLVAPSPSLKRAVREGAYRGAGLKGAHLTPAGASWSRGRRALDRAASFC